jgi:hypothetical protein
MGAGIHFFLLLSPLFYPRDSVLQHPSLRRRLPLFSLLLLLDFPLLRLNSREAWAAMMST